MWPHTFGRLRFMLHDCCGCYCGFLFKLIDDHVRCSSPTAQADLSFLSSRRRLVLYLRCNSCLRSTSSLFPCISCLARFLVIDKLGLHSAMTSDDHSWIGMKCLCGKILYHDSKKWADGWCEESEDFFMYRMCQHAGGCEKWSSADIEWGALHSHGIEPTFWDHNRQSMGRGPQKFWKTD